MHIDQLRNLVHIARLGSINKASEQAHISQQALSTSMQRLEEEVGCALLARHARGITLTENGQRLEKAAEEMLRILDDCLNEMTVAERPSKEVREVMRVLFSPAIGNTFVPTISKVFSSRHANCQLLLMEKESSEIIDAIFTDALEAIGLVGSFFDMPPSDEMRKVIHIYDDKLYAVVAKTHPLAGQKSISIKSLLKYPLAVYQGSDTSANAVCTLLESAGTPNYHIITNNLAIFQNTILFQKTVGFINLWAIKNNTAITDIIGDVVTLPIRNCPPLSYYALANQPYYDTHQESIQDFLAIYRSLF